MWQAKEIRFASDHPTAPGHFPLRPIIPGVLLLDEAIKPVEGGIGRSEEICVRAAKFHHPVRPGEAVILRWEAQRPKIIRFECRLADCDILVASGVVEIVAARA